MQAVVAVLVYSQRGYVRGFPVKYFQPPAIGADIYCITMGGDCLYKIVLKSGDVCKRTRFKVEREQAVVECPEKNPVATD